MPGERPWPRQCRGAISLTFDDGTPSQLEKVVPLLEKYRFSGTFYLIPRGDDWRAHLEKWRPVAAAGHEIGNHTTRHICSRQRTGGPKDQGCLEGATLEIIEQDIQLAEERLNAVFGPVERSFCYPCYQTHVGEGPTRQSYVPVVARRFKAARGTGPYGGNHYASADLHHLWSWRCEHMTAAELIGHAEHCAASGFWDVFTFHGIDEGHLSVSAFNFEQFLAHLDRRRDVLWTAPIITVANAILDWRAGQ